ncbi:MAG: phosphatase PAP2 family protein [Sulfuriferula sp.]
MITWQTITNLASFSVIAPAAVAVTAWLLLGRAWRLTAWWLILFLGGMTLVVASKIAFIGWGIGSREYDFTGFSGHAVRAMAIVPVLLYLVSQRASAYLRVVSVLLGLAFGTLIAISRIEVHAHSLSESVTGWLLGALISFGMIYLLKQSPPIRANHWFLALGLLGLVFASPYAEPTPTQRWITQAALHLSGHDRPYIRVTWRLAPKSWKSSNESEF